MTKKKSNVELANDLVDIFMVYNMIGMKVSPVYDVRSIKVHCPFDIGRDASPAFRIYPSTNSAYCFSCQAYYSPVKLASIAWEKTYKEAADILLEKIGHKPPTPEEIWNQAVQVEVQPPDLSSLGQALQLYCATLSVDWEMKQFDPEIAKWLDSCLSLLSCVKTETDAEKWIAGSKKVMTQVLSG